MLFSEGVRTGRISVERFVELVAKNPARLFGIYPRKGTIVVSSDADLVIWDTAEVRAVSGSRLLSGSDYSVYEGREVHGWPAVTVSRGEVVFADGEMTAEPRPLGHASVAAPTYSEASARATASTASSGGRNSAW
jgi:dihydropyrimidinase